MADSFKVLGQSKPAGATLADLYTVPAATSSTVSTINVCNQGTATTFRISVAPAGVADALTQYLVYDAPILSNDSLPFTIGITLATTDKIRVQSASGNVSFSAFGVEIT